MFHSFRELKMKNIEILLCVAFALRMSSFLLDPIIPLAPSDKEKGGKRAVWERVKIAQAL
jgi:hypothetical protein